MGEAKQKQLSTKTDISEPKKGQSFITRFIKQIPKKFLFAAALALVAIGVALYFMYKPNPDNSGQTYTINNVQAATRVVTSNGSVSKLHNYQEAYTAGQIADALSKYRTAYAAYKVALSFTKDPNAQLYLNLAYDAQQLHDTNAVKYYNQLAINDKNTSDTDKAGLLTAKQEMNKK